MTDPTIALWIPVTNKLPPIDTLVIVEGGLARYMGFGKWLSFQSNRQIEWKVTHWLPFPEPPPKPMVDLSLNPQLAKLVKETEPVWDIIAQRYGKEVADGWDRITQALAQPPGSTHFKREW